jgi:hypothetical protein
MDDSKHLNHEQLALLPTAEDVAFYEEHGWYISQKVLPDEIIDEAIKGSERYYREERDTLLSISSGYSDWQPKDGDDVIRNNEFVSLQNKQLRFLALQPIIGAIASRLAKTKQIRLLDDQLVSDDSTLVAKARFLATQARDSAPYYQHSEIGYNYRLSNVLAGIGRAQLRVLSDRITQTPVFIT